jgi:hypothetical protein
MKISFKKNKKQLDFSILNGKTGQFNAEFKSDCLSASLCLSGLK